jgi:hypothetical protein
MNSEQFARLKDLFSQLNAIEQEIETILQFNAYEEADKKPAELFTHKRKSAKKQAKAKKKTPKPAGKRPYKKRDKSLKGYTCKDCDFEFKSNIPFIDLTCPECNGIRINKQ